MALYPASLLPKKTYPILANEEILNNALIRETTTDLYLLLGKKGYTPDDILPFIVAPQPSLREVFELSLFLYGCYDEQYYGIRVSDRTLYADWTEEQPELVAETIQFTQESAWPLFLAAKKLDRQMIDFNGEDHLDESSGSKNKWLVRIMLYIAGYEDRVCGLGNIIKPAVAFIRH
jgi:hypothetical protein